MAYSEQTVTTIDSVPGVIAAFAAARGWSVAGTTLTRPGGGRSFEITATIAGTLHRLYVTDKADVTRRTWTQLPWVDGSVNVPTVLLPTKVHLFGNDDPWEQEPWIAAVIECGYNHYRHVYIGNVAKIGNWSGGEVICSNYFNHRYIGAGGSIPFMTADHKYQFSAHHNSGGGTGPGGASAGGVNVVHAENAQPWRYFDGPSSNNAHLNFSGVEVFGGWADAINSGLARRGISDYAGSNILVPVNLYCPDSVNAGANVRFRPLGHLPGVRLIDMRGIDPAESIEVGNQNWRVFPEFSKRSATTTYFGTSRADGGAGGWYPPYETSYMLGLAYREG